MTEEAKAVVLLSVHDHAGTSISEEQIPLPEWYDELHPLIDDPAVRKAQGIGMIEGTQINARGEVYQRWRVTYAADGTVVESTELPVS